MCFLIAVSISLLLQGQVNKFPFHHFGHYSTDNGLSADNVYQVMQDSKGFIWLACGNGLNRFDGYTFKIYNSNQSDSNSFSPGWFTGLKEDASGMIWMSSANDGLYSFNPNSETFTHYNHIPQNTNSLIDDIVNSFAIDKNGILWIGTENGLDAFDPNTKQFSHYNHDVNDPSTISSDNIKNVGLDGNDNLWIITVAAGADCFKTSTGKILKHYSFNCNNSLAGDEREVNYEISKGSGDMMWFATWKDGLIGFNIKTGQIVQYLHNPHVANSLSDNSVLSVYEDQNENLWIATQAPGLDYFDHSSKSFFHTDLPNLSPADRSHLGSITRDRSGQIWITSDHGLFTCDGKLPAFTSFLHDINSNSIDDNTVGSFLSDSRGNFLIGASGIDYFNKNNGGFSPLGVFDHGKNILSGNPATNIREDNKGNLMFALSQGLLFYNPQTKTHHYYKHVENDFTTLSEVSVNDIFQDTKGRYWATVWQGGLDAINAETGKVRSFKVHSGGNSISTNSVGGIFEDSGGNLLIGSQNGGLINFNPNTETFTIYKHRSNDSTSLSNNTAFNFIEEKNGIIWVGTRGGGINAFNPKTGKFRAFTSKDGLCNDAIFCMIKDNNGNIWLGTGNGISCFTPPKDPFDFSCKFHFRSYDKSDGLPGNVINFFATYKDKDGFIYFGTVNAGFFYFHPDSLKDNTYLPPVYITDFSLFNKTVLINDASHLLSSPIEITHKIELNYSQNLISFSFAALNYIHPEKNKYAYKLEGFDKEWLYTDASRRFAKYTNLDAGDYIFKVRGSNNDGIWNDRETVIYLSIIPPYWQTSWFKCLIGLGIITLVIGLYRFRLTQLLKFQSARNKIASDLHDDIGSTLNSISVYSEVAKKDTANRDEALDMIGDSSRKIIDSLSDIVWAINPAYDSFTRLISRMRSLSYNLFRAKQIEFTFRSDEKLDDLKLAMIQRQNFYLIFKEAITNIIKYSNARSAIIQISLTDKMVNLVIRDDGIGFNPLQPTEGNGLGNMKQRAQAINAKLEIDSIEGSGTSIKLSFRK